MTQDRGFISKLFDFSFSEFIAIQIVGVLYLLGVIVAALAALAILIGGFTQGFATGIGAVIVAPIVFFLYVIFIRIGLEAFIASIRTVENTRRMAEFLKNTSRLP